MKTKLYLMIVILALAVTLVACSGSDQAKLDGTSWVLFTYRDTKPLDMTRPSLSFNAGEVSGNASCNNFGGSYELDGDQISFGPMFMTEMYCVDPEGIMDQESLYLQMLGSAEQFELSEGQLLIFGSGGETLTFVPAE